MVYKTTVGRRGRRPLQDCDTRTNGTDYMEKFYEFVF